MKLGVIWNSFKKAVAPLVERVTGSSVVKAEGTLAAKAATSPKIASFDEAMNTSRSLGQLTELGLVEPAKFAKSARAVLDSPQSGNFAHEVTRHTSGALKDNPNSVELLSTLAKGHKQLDQNITERMARARHIDDPAELRAIHTNNIRDARAIIDTGAPATLRDDAFKDIAKSLDGLMTTDPAAASRITKELAKDPVMVKGVGDAAKAMRAREAAQHQAHTAAPAAPAAPAKPAIKDSDREWADERLRNLGVFPSSGTHPTTASRRAVLPELSLVDDAVPMRAGATSYPAGAPLPQNGTSPTATAAWESLARPRQMSAVEEYAARTSGVSTNVLRPQHVEGMEVREIDMSLDAFRALETAANKAAVKAPVTTKPIAHN